MPIRPTIADAEHEVGGEHVRVAVTMRRLQPAHADHQRVVVGYRAPAHQRRDHRDAGQFGEFDEQIRRIGIDDAAAGDDQRPLGVVQHRERFFDLLARGLRLVDGQRLVGVGIELDLGHLHVERQVDQHRARPAGAHHVERLLEHARHQRGLAHDDRPLGNRFRDRFDVDCLEIFLVEPRAWRLPGDAQDRDRIRLRGIEPRDHVGAGGTRSPDANTNVTGGRAGVALRHMRRAFDMAREDMRDAAARLQR